MGQRSERSATLALVLSTVAFAVCFYAWTLYGPLAPTVQKLLGLSELQVGWLVAIPVVLGSLMRIPLGVWAQRFGGREVFVALMALVLVPLLAITVWHTTFVALITFGLLLGVAGASFAVGVPFVNGWYPPERRGFALGVYGIGTGGTVIAGLTAPLLAGAYGIVAPFIVAAVMIAAMAIIIAVFGRNAPNALPAQTGLSRAFDVFRTSPRAWALTLMYFVSFGGFVAMFLYLPRILVSVHELTKPDAGARAAGFALIAVLARPVGGMLADRIGAERVLGYALAAITVVALGLSVAFTSMLPFTVCCLTLGAALGMGSGAIFKIVGTEFPDSVGAVTGVVGAAGGLGGFFPPIVMGVVKTFTGSYSLGFVMLGVVAAVCLVLLLAGRIGRTSKAHAAG